MLHIGQHVVCVDDRFVPLLALLSWDRTNDWDISVHGQ
jgi:hypothetical protein